MEDEIKNRNKNLSVYYLEKHEDDGDDKSAVVTTYNIDILNNTNINAEVKRLLPPWSSISEIQIWLASHVDELSNLLVIFLKEFQRLSDQGAISVSARYFETINNIITNTNIHWFGSDTEDAVQLREKLAKCLYYLKHHLSNAIAVLYHQLEIFVVVEKQLYSKMRARKLNNSLDSNNNTNNYNNNYNNNRNNNSMKSKMKIIGRIQKFMYRGGGLNSNNDTGDDSTDNIQSIFVDDFKKPSSFVDPETQQQGGNKSNKNPFQNAKGMSSLFSNNDSRKNNHQNNKNALKMKKDYQNDKPKSVSRPTMVELNEQFDSITSTANGIGIGISPRNSNSNSNYKKIDNDETDTSPIGYHNNYMRSKNNKPDGHNNIPFSSPSIKTTNKLKTKQLQSSYLSLSQSVMDPTGEDNQYKAESILTKKNYQGDNKFSPSKKKKNSPSKRKQSPFKTVSPKKAGSNINHRVPSGGKTKSQRKGANDGRSPSKTKANDYVGNKFISPINQNDKTNNVRRRSPRSASPRSASPAISTSSSTTSPSSRERYLKSNVKVGSRIVLKSGKDAIVRFTGKTHFAKGIWYGVELIGKDVFGGRNNGKVEGVQYFRCLNEPEQNNGLFVQISRIKEMKSKVLERKAWSLKKIPKTLMKNDQYAPSKLTDDVVKKIGQKLRAACFRVSKTSNQISSLVPWLNMSNSNNDKYLNMTVAEIKKAFRQKGVTRRLISDVDMDDFLLSFSDQFYNSSTINRKDIPNTNVNVSNLAKFLQQTKSAAIQGQHNNNNDNKNNDNSKKVTDYGSTVNGANISLHSHSSRIKSNVEATRIHNATDAARERSSTILASKGRRGAFDEDGRNSKMLSKSSTFDISNDQKLLVAIQDGLEYVYQMQTDVIKNSSSPRISPRNGIEVKKKTSKKKIQSKSPSPIKSLSSNGYNDKKTENLKKKKNKFLSNAASTPFTKKQASNRTRNIVLPSPPRRKPPPVPIEILDNRVDNVDETVAEQAVPNDPVSNLVYQILGPPPAPL